MDNEDVLDYIEKNCGEDVKNYIIEEMDTLKTTIKNQKTEIENLEEELYIAHTEDEEE
jgi:NADH/NAD ratio-sensing transcriptional regulator Rex